ncbi:MAG TPA: pyrroline-5-carboxylate reductase [Firmicutes bacterium]|nr:pyrroline-5-carboxylate reductase [Bacillota bacterium]
MKLGFIGFGNMASAIADGLVSAKALSSEQIYASAKNWEKLCKNTSARGIHACRDTGEVIECSDMLVVAVKPYQVRDVLSPYINQLNGKILVSVAAGMTFECYEEFLPAGVHHISTIPNTPVSICEGIIACEQRHSLTQQEYDVFFNLFSHIGLVQPVETHLLSVAGTVAGCGPAFAAMFLEALSDAGVKHGLPRALSYRLASQMLAGTAKLQLATNAHPGQMKDAVCSPGGTTIVGVSALEKNGFRHAVIDAIDAIENK